MDEIHREAARVFHEVQRTASEYNVRGDLERGRSRPSCAWRKSVALASGLKTLASKQASKTLPP